MDRKPTEQQPGFWTNLLNLVRNPAEAAPPTLLQGREFNPYVPPISEGTVSAEESMKKAFGGSR